MKRTALLLLIIFTIVIGITAPIAYLVSHEFSDSTEVIDEIEDAEEPDEIEHGEIEPDTTEPVGEPVEDIPAYEASDYEQELREHFDYNVDMSDVDITELPLDVDYLVTDDPHGTESGYVNIVYMTLAFAIKDYFGDMLDGVYTYNEADDLTLIGDTSMFYKVNVHGPIELSITVNGFDNLIRVQEIWDFDDEPGTDPVYDESIAGNDWYNGVTKLGDAFYNSDMTWELPTEWVPSAECKDALDESVLRVTAYAGYDWLYVLVSYFDDVEPILVKDVIDNNYIVTDEDGNEYIIWTNGAYGYIRKLEDF